MAAPRGRGGGPRALAKALLVRRERRLRVDGAEIGIVTVVVEGPVAGRHFEC